MKKKIPIGLRKILDAESIGNNEIFTTEFTDNCIIRFKDTDIESDYFFEITKINLSQVLNDISYSIKYKPSNEMTTELGSTSTKLSGFRDYFKKWKALLIESNKESPLFDDYFTQTYFEELEPKFEILDEDADFKPYSIEQQKRIIKFLDNVEKIITEQGTDEQIEKETIALITETKTNISKTTKKNVVKNIRKIIAKGFKIGLLVGEKLLIEFTTELAKKLLLGG
tara:strand:- start:35 stop:712 length:678 start_codon:yes stop_codon:yes gene_type:complete